MNYVCSDIHGRYDKYISMFESGLVKPEDKLYILGDVIDRGTDGVKILQDISKRDNVEFFCGNHELFMIMTFFIEDDDLSKESFENWTCSQNGGKVTYDEMLKLSDEEIKEIYNLLSSSYVFKHITVENRRYYLSHAGVSVKASRMDEVRVKDVDILEVFGTVWKSVLKALTNTKADEGTTVIVGHKPVQLFHTSSEIYKQGNIIDIDGGLAIGDDSRSNLIVYRLDDETPFYL